MSSRSVENQDETNERSGKLSKRRGNGPKEALVNKMQIIKISQEQLNKTQLRLDPRQRNFLTQSLVHLLPREDNILKEVPANPGVATIFYQVPPPRNCIEIMATFCWIQNQEFEICSRNGEISRQSCSISCGTVRWPWGEGADPFCGALPGNQSGCSTCPDKMKRIQYKSFTILNALFMNLCVYLTCDGQYCFIT